MTWQWLALGALALGAVLLVAALARLRSRTRAELAAARAESAALRERLDRLEAEQVRPEPPVRAEEREYTITHLGEQPTEVEPVSLERAVFADLLLRESVIRLGSLSHGVRRALSAESRNRIRFEMKREVKRARKQRRVEQREAYREWQARKRRRVTEQDVA
ncbi:hypothetical protein GCM10009623_00890 [Nocardioides aestuarii]|uniref:Uncharacterized protein n=1 Tax=Nocardioides aestuarii TaxID=252231 RepID=A0ABW4TJZ4_9ACTN